MDVQTERHCIVVLDPSSPPSEDGNVGLQTSVH